MELGGAVAVIWVSDSTAKLEAGVGPNLTALAAVKLVPVIVTLVPPATEPEVGVIEVIAGVGWTSALSSISSPGLVPLGATVAPSMGGGKIKAKLAPGTVAIPISSVVLVGSIPTRSPAWIGTFVVKVWSPAPDGVA